MPTPVPPPVGRAAPSSGCRSAPCEGARGMASRYGCSNQMEVGLTDRVREVAELVSVALEEPAGERPQAKPLAARQLPNGAWLRVVPGTPEPLPASPPAPPAQVVAPEQVAVAQGQLDLFAWKPRQGEQLRLF